MPAISVFPKLGELLDDRTNNLSTSADTPGPGTEKLIFFFFSLVRISASRNRRMSNTLSRGLICCVVRSSSVWLSSSALSSLSSSKYTSSCSSCPSSSLFPSSFCATAYRHRPRRLNPICASALPNQDPGPHRPSDISRHAQPTGVLLSSFSRKRGVGKRRYTYIAFLMGDAGITI